MTLCAVLGFESPGGALVFWAPRLPRPYLRQLRQGQLTGHRVAADAELRWVMHADRPEIAIALCDRLENSTPLVARDLAAEWSAGTDVVAAFEATALSARGRMSDAWRQLREAVGAFSFSDSDSAFARPSTRSVTGISEEDCPFAPPLAAGAGRPDIVAFAGGGQRGPRLAIFALDRGLADTDDLRWFRTEERWSMVGDRIADLAPLPAAGEVAPHELAGALQSEGVRLAVVTSADRDYATGVLAEPDLKPDHLETGVAPIRTEAFRRVIRAAGCDATEAVVFATTSAELAAADAVGAWTLGSPFPTPYLDPPADISWWDAETLLAAPSWLPELRYAAEIRFDEPIIWHRGSLIHTGEDAWALGRYFTSRHPRHRAKLSQAVLAQKDTRRRAQRIAAAFDLAVDRLSDYVELQAVISVPPNAGQIDRFEHYRAAVCALTSAREVQAREVAPPGVNYKRLGAYDRRQANDGRFVVDADLSGMTVLLLDDVRTTGSTIDGLRVAAEEARAERVLQLVFATCVSP